MSRSALERSALGKLHNGQQPAPPVPPQIMYAFPSQQIILNGMMPMPGPLGVMTAAYAPTNVAEEEPVHPSNVLPMHGNTSNYNINNLLYNNILENDYFKALYQLRTYHEVLDEIYRSVVHVEPWQTGTARFPSTAFCLMVKFMLMKLTVKQMKGLLTTSDNAFVRAIGFLYLRYTCPPADLWLWVEPYLEDEEEFAPLSDQTVRMTVGAFVTKLLTDMQYYGTTLPRIPVPIERKMKVLLLLLSEKKARRKQNLRSLGQFSVGTKVRAIYGDAENEPAWYDAVIESKEEGEEMEDSQQQHRFWVKFPEYGNTECVDLGDMELLVPDKLPQSTAHAKSSGRREERTESRRSRSRSRSNESRDRDRRSRSRDHRSSHRSDHRDRDHDSDSRRRDRHDSREADRDRRSRDDSRSRRGDSSSRDRRSGSGDRRGPTSSSSGGGALSSRNTSTDNLLARVLQSEREASAAVGRNYGHRPTSYKGSLSLKIDRYTARQKSPPRSDFANERGATKRQRSPSPAKSSAAVSSSSRPAEMSAEQLNRMKALKDRYGDASASLK